MTNRIAYIILNLIPGIGTIKVKKLLEHYQSPIEILEEKSQILSKFSGIGPKISSTIAQWRNYVDIDQEIKTTESAGVSLITLADPEYPSLLREIYDPPLCLYVRGNVKSLSVPLILAIVGSRRTTRYGIESTKRLAISAVQSGWTVVSGLARGIDTAAHRSVLESDGTTIAVLGSGLGKIYPQDNVGLARQICEHGAIVSEFPMLSPPDRKSFPMRNRIISGLCKGTLVMEAGHHSGALITAQQAIDQGRQVFAVPGPINMPQSKGCHYLIKDGAKLVENFGDVLDEFSLFPNPRRHSEESRNLFEKPKETGELNHTFTDTEQQIVEELKEGELTVDEINQHTKIPTADILSSLLHLEIKKLVNQYPGCRYGLRH